MNKLFALAAGAEQCLYGVNQQSITAALVQQASVTRETMK
jgi:hypothetical protein